MRKPKTEFVPALDKRLLKRLQSSGNWILDSAAENAADFNRLLAAIPRKYPWEFMSADAFRQAAGNLNTGPELYRQYWHDMLGQIEAFGVMSAWRLAELARSAVWAIRRDDVLCGAIMARAALETAAAYAWLQTEVRPTLDKIAGGASPTFVKDLEDKLLKVVFASKLEEADEFYKPTNIVTIIQKIAGKVPHQEMIAPVYYALCEVAHPNFSGRSIYIVDGTVTDVPGRQTRIISLQHGPAALDVIRDAVTALSWSMGTFSRSFIAFQDSLRRMFDHVARIDRA